MAEPSSPWDDAPVEEPPRPPKQNRRPWWQWNVRILFVALFCLAWCRYLFDVDIGTVWAIVIGVVGLWAWLPCMRFSEGIEDPERDAEELRPHFEALNEAKSRKKWH